MEAHRQHLRARGLSRRTEETYRERLRDFGQYLASRGYDLLDVTQFVVADYLGWLRERPDSRATKRPKKLSPTTCQDVYTSLRAFANYLHSAKLLRHNFMEGVQKPKVPPLAPITVPEEVLRAILDALNPRRPPAGYPLGKWRFMALRNRAIVLGLVDSMLRSAELRNLNVEDVEFGQGMIHVLGKGGKARRVPFSAETARALKLYLDERRRRFRTPYDRGVLFLDLSGRPLSKAALRSIFASLKRLVAFDGRFFPHAIRHTAAKMALRQGADVFSLAKTLGHSTLAVTRRYAELDDAEIARQHRIWSPASRLLRGR